MEQRPVSAKPESNSKDNSGANPQSEPISPQDAAQSSRSPLPKLEAAPSRSGFEAPDGSSGIKPDHQNKGREKAESIEAPLIAEAPSFPQLRNHAPTSPKPALHYARSDLEDDEPIAAKGFQRSSSPSSTTQRLDDVMYHEFGGGLCTMYRFSLYETASKFYMVGGDVLDRRFRILKIDRIAKGDGLSIVEDDVIYTKREMNQLLNAVDDGNKSSGGLKLRCSSWGLLGFIKFTGAYYILVVTKRSQVAMLGGHYIYQVDGTELISLPGSSSSRFKLERESEEARFLATFHNLDLSRSFYFSYSYDITHTLQNNIIHLREASYPGSGNTFQNRRNSMFIWNHHLLEPAAKMLKSLDGWCLPVVHGYVDQAKILVYGRTIYITVIARRSRYFAGARFLKRGANDLGQVANDVETEQIVSEMLTTSFHAPGPELYANPNYTSYVQHRGSIPLHWTQDNTGVTPRPDIDMSRVDPFYSAAALHFDDLFKRYGTPIYVLNLVKARERTPRESILLKEFTNAITYLNQFLPREKEILYKAWDMSRASKSRDQDVITTLESIAADVLSVTGFFRNGNDHSPTLRLQNGVARTNCIDCLDRTNAAQFVIGKSALGCQLHALGVIESPFINFDTDAVNLLTHMYHDHGDTIAIQYGGSHLVNTMETYRKINQWTSNSRDMVESFKRYYNNSFLDHQRQEAYNLFLGNYIFAQGQPMLWDLSTDYYLHHVDPRLWSTKTRKSYVNWFTPENLTPPKMPEISTPILTTSPQNHDDYWFEYYRPLAITSFAKLFPLRMNSTFRYIPFKSTQDGNYDLSPFRVRSGNDHESPEKGRIRKEVTIADAKNTKDGSNPSASHLTGKLFGSKTTALPSWSHTQQGPSLKHGITKDRSANPISASHRPSTNPSQDDKPPKDKSAITQWALHQFVTNSLNPSVAGNEAHEYQRYISHPHNLPLVTSTDTPPDPHSDLLDYVSTAALEAIPGMSSSDDDVVDFEAFLDVGDEPLTVTEADIVKKRYKAYRQWLKGKSLFKQQLVDPFVYS